MVGRVPKFIGGGGSSEIISAIVCLAFLSNKKRDLAFAWTQPRHQNGQIQGLTWGSQCFLHPPNRSLDLKPTDMDGVHYFLFAVVLHQS
ncbi:hypothetical protein ACTXT7_011071 [Hymenolepis weldensis]